MLILLFFAFLAGIVTVLSPCVIPILPALLAAGTGEGRLRSVGIVSGVVVSFVFFTLFLSAIIQATHLSADVLRYAAIVIIALFGLVMLFPSLGDWFAKTTSGITTLGQKLQSHAGDITSGYWSGFVLGSALGLVWTPCAGPILAAVTTLAATSAITWHTFLLTITYALGAAIPMFIITYGGGKTLTSTKFLSRHAEAIRRVFGGLMLLAALAIALHWDVKFQQFAIQYIPFVNIEDNPIVIDELNKLNQDGEGNLQTKLKEHGKDLSKLPKLVAAPNFVGIDYWINTAPLSMEELKGKVVLIDFWTYSCINCIRTLPYITKWYDTYKDQGLVIVGVHTPEFEFEKKESNVEDAVKRFGIHYPVALDNQHKTWKAYSNLYWPAHYLIDQEGIIRYFHFGEGAYVETENAIRNLLGLVPLHKEEEHVKLKPTTPETYLGLNRAEGYQPGMKLSSNTSEYSYKPPLTNDHIGLIGKWTVGEEKITSQSDNSQLDLNFLATQVYLVMDSDEEVLVTVLLDDIPLPEKYYTADMNEKGQLRVHEARKYDIIDLKGNYGRHKLTLITPQKGVSMYAFTFGS